MHKFKILHRDGKARVGKLITPHGVIDTPNFIPVGTQATVKALTPKDLKEIGVQIVLANTYHLMLRPGSDLIEKMGGLHKFMGWDGPIMTDSGGFQVFSLGVGMESGEEKVVREKREGVRGEIIKKKNKMAHVSGNGVTFYSHLDGSKYFLGPEESVKIQQKLGADIIVAFDDHESIKMTKKEMLRSLELTKNWGLRSLDTLRKVKSKQLMFGVVHGGLYKDLRVQSAKFTDKNFAAIAIGGIYGERKNLREIIAWVLGNVSYKKIRHLLGIGEVEDLLNGVERGIDLFDCVAPMRRARNGSLYIDNSMYQRRNFTLNIRMGKFINDKKPIDPTCNCYTCENFSRVYLHHLYESGELLYHKLATYHNVYFIINLMKKIRNAIANGTFVKLKKEYMGM